jgi:NADH dehydrogenase
MERPAQGGTLIAGGGYAGSLAAQRLGRHGATIVSPENFMLFTPLLPEAASGTLEPRHVVVPLRMAGSSRAPTTCTSCRSPRGSSGVLVDWTVALFFRRDIAELGLLGHPRRLEI